MKTPQLNRKLTLEDPQDVPDGAGGFDRLWVPLGTHWAQVKPRSGRESSRGVAPTGLVPVAIMVRASVSGSAARPRPEQRFRDGSRVYHLLSVTEADFKGRYLICQAEEEVVA